MFPLPSLWPQGADKDKCDSARTWEPFQMRRTGPAIGDVACRGGEVDGHRGLHRMLKRGPRESPADRENKARLLPARTSLARGDLTAHHRSTTDADQKSHRLQPQPVRRHHSFQRFPKGARWTPEVTSLQRRDGPCELRPRWEFTASFPQHVGASARPHAESPRSCAWRFVLFATHNRSTDTDVATRETVRMPSYFAQSLAGATQRRFPETMI